MPFVDQTTIDLTWDWVHDSQVIDYFAIGHNPEIAANDVPSFVPFWHREYTLECLLPGQDVNVMLRSVIKDGDDNYYNSDPFTSAFLTSK